MNDIVSFSVNGESYDIPKSEVDGFLSEFPDAVEVQTFISDKDTFDIPLDEVDGFKSEFPDAKEMLSVKKKEQTEPTQDAPLQGLGGVSEEPTPSPSVGQGVLRGVDQTQPTGEEFIARASDLTRTDVREPQVDGQGLTQVSEITEPFVMEEQPLPDTEDVLEKQRLYDNKMQSERNENIKKYGLDVTEGQLTDVFESPIPEEEDIESYLSKQIGRVTSSANNIVNNPKSFGLPADISQMNPNEREEVVDRYIARNYEMRGNGVNMNESELRNVFNQKFDQALAKRKADRDVMLAKESDDELLKAGVSEEGLKPYKLAKQKQSDVASLNPNETKLYEANVKLQDITSQIKSITSKYEKETGDKLISKVGGKTVDQRISELNSEGDNLTKLQEKGFTDQASLDAFNKRVDAYNSNLESVNKEIESEKIKQDKIQKDYAKDQETLLKLRGEYQSQQEVTKSLMGNIREDGRIMVDYLTGQHVDKMSDDDDADITEAVNAQIVEFNQPTYKDQLDDIYIKVGLRDQRHREFGNEATDDVTIGTTGMARDFSSDAAINRLRSLGYEEVGGVGEVTFKNVPIREQASSYVINVLDESKRDRADRWIATNKQNLIEKEALKNMVLLNVDPGKFDKSKLARGIEVLAEESLPSYASVDKALGFTSDRKLIDAALPLLQEEGIELTKEQEDNLERTFGEEATEATFGMAPVIVKLGLINSIAGPVRAISGFGNLVDKLSKSKSLVDRGIALFLDASFEEVQMQTAGFDPGTGFGFNVAGKIFKGIGLDKFPFKGKGEMARFNKSADALWNHAIKGASSAEFASNVEAVIKDFEGGETWQNFADENYSNLSDVTKRMLVNGVAFGVLGLRDVGFFIKKGKSGFNISNMEKARDEAQRKGYKEESDMLTKYINEYYAGKPGKAQTASYNDMKLFVENVPENESKRFTVSSLEEVPVEFRDIAKKNKSVETEVDRTFLGIPLGKKKVNSGESYSYELTGKEIREVFNKKKEGKTEAEFEQEFDMSQKTEEPSVGKEVMRTEPVEKEPTYEEPEVFTSPTEAEYAEVNRNDGKGDVKLTREEYEMEMAKKFAETQPTPKEPAAKEQLALGEGKAEPKEDAPVEILSKSIDVSDDSNRKGLTTVEQLKDFIGEDRVGDAEMPTSRETIDKLKEDIKENGFKEPIVVVYDKLSGEGEASIIEGNHRMQAAIELGLKEVPVKFEKGTLRTNEQRKADDMFPLNRKTVGEIDTRFGVDGTKLGLDVRQPTEKDVVTKTKQDAIQEPSTAGAPKIEPLTKEDAKSEEKVNKKIEEDSGEKDLVKEVVKSTVTEEEKKKVAEEEGIDESEVESKIEEEVKNQINDKTEKEPKTLLQRIASRIRKAIMSLLIVANAFNISGVKAPTAKSKAYDNIKVENLQSFDKMYMDQEAVNKKNNIDIIRKGQANKNENYIIVDKSTGSAHLFKGENLITSYEVGVGKTPGDIETKLKSIYIDGKTGKQVPISVATKLHSNGIRYIKDGYSSRTNWNEGTRTTGAGIFTINKTGKYKGKDAFYLNTEQGMSTEMALHKPSNVHRSVLMSDGNPDNNRITNGCVNFQYADLSDLVKIGLTSGNKVYVLPDNPNNVFKLVDGELRFQSADPKVNRTTASTKPFQAQPITLKAKGVVPQSSKEFLIGISENKADIMSLYPAISNDIYNRIAKVAYGIFGQESSFGTYSGPRGKIGAIKDRIQSELEGVGFEDVTVLGKQIKASDASVGVTQIRLSSVNQKVKERFEINKTNDLFDMNKSSVATMSVLLDIYTNEIPSNMKEDFEKLLPLAWSNRTEFDKAKKGDDSAFNNRYIQKVSKNADGLDVYMGENPIEKPSKKESPADGDAPIGLMALPLLFGGARRKRKPLEDTDADKVVTEWMGDVQKIYDAQKTKNKEEARNQAAINLALSGKLDNLAPDQVSKILDSIKKETEVMGKKWSVSTLSELEGLTIKEQFKQGFEEYVAAMKQKESDKIQKAKETAQAKIDAVKERTAKAIEKIKAKKEAEKIEYKDKIEKLKKESKADKEARKLFEAIVNDIAKDAGLSQISRNKASELLKSSRDVNAENIERLLEKAVRVIEYEYKRNIVKESDKKIKDFNTNIKKNKFGTLTQSAKELAGITTEDIPIGLLPRFVDVMDGVSKKSPSAKDLDDLAKFMSEFKNELDKQITDIQFFADVLNDFYSSQYRESGSIKLEDKREYLKDNGFSDAQIEFFEKNQKAINAAYNSFYTNEGKDLTAQEKAQKISEQMLDAKKVFRQMEEAGEAKVDMKKFKGKVQQEVNIAEFFNNIKESDIDYLTRTEANKLPVLFDNLNRGMVTNATFKIMNRIKGGRKLDSFVKLDPKSPIKRVKTKDELFESFVSNAGEIAKLDRVFDPATLKSSGELTKDIEKKTLDYADEVIKGLKGKPLYEEISKVIRPLVNANTRTARVHEKANELFKKMDGSPLHNTTIMSVYFRSREFDLNPDNAKIRNPLDYINKTLENPNLSEKKRVILNGIKNEYFRNGKPLTKNMLSSIEKSKGGSLIDFMDKVMAESKDDVRFMSEVIESSPVEFFMGYQPRSTIEGKQSIEDLLSDVSNNVGRPSLKTSAVKSRETGVNALNFDAMDDFMRTATSIDLQRSIAPALAELNAFISEASRSGNSDAKIFADTLKKVVESYVKNTLSRDYKQKGIYANIFGSMGKKLKRNTLAGISKATVESIIQLGKIHIDEDASNAFYKNASMKRDVNNQQVLEALNSIHVARAGVLSSEMSRTRSYIADAVRRGDASKAEELIYSASKTIPGRAVSGVDDFMGDFNTALIKFPDLIGTIQSAIGGAAIRFKEITGKELDFDKLVKDPEYKAKYKDELEASIAYGDQLATRMGGPGSMEQKSLKDIKGGELWDMNRFVRSFSTNENEQILSSLTTLGVPTLSKITGRNKGRQRGAEFENKRKAARGLASSLFGLGAYTSFKMALGTLIIGMFGAMLNGDDWDEEFDNWDWDVFKARVLGDTVWTALFGKFGVIESLVMQSIIAYGVRQSYKANGKEELGEKIADGMFYSTVSQDDKATKEWKMLGPEGKLLGSMLEIVYVLADAAENDDVDLLSSPSSKNNIYTIAKGVVNLGAAQDVGTGVRKMWYGRDENRKVRESFGKNGDSKIVNEVEKEVLRLYKETRERSIMPSMIEDKPRKITEKGVSIDVFIHGFSVKELQRLKGDFIRREAEKLINTRDYKNVSDSKKIKLLKSIYGNWRRSESINSVSKGKYKSIDDFYKHNDNILKFERSLR